MKTTNIKKDQLDLFEWSGIEYPEKPKFDEEQMLFIQRALAAHGFIITPMEGVSHGHEQLVRRRGAKP